jgi:hypothetical protein
MSNIGRPTKYTPELLEKAHEYLDRWEELGDYIPQLAGMALHCDISTETVQEWKKDSKKNEFSVLCARVLLMQQRVLINKGLSRKADASLSKLLLMKHGYSEKQEVDVSSSDGSMSPTRIELVAPDSAED